MEDSAIRNLRLFQGLCGQAALENVLLTTTHWSNVNLAEAELREAKLRNRDFWGALIDKGATLQRFQGTRDSGLDLIKKLMSRTRKPLHIQDQIVEQNMTLLETNAGQCINKELMGQERRFKERMKSLEEEVRGAIEEVGDELRAMSAGMKALLDEKAKAQKELEKAVAEMKLLTELHAAEAKLRETRERQEEAGACDRGVIAVDTEDLAGAAEITGLLKSYNTKGRLILDINNHEEFKSDAVKITINYEFSLVSAIGVYMSTSGGEFDARIGYIDLDGVRYRCQSGACVSRVSQKFVIFSKC